MEAKKIMNLVLTNVMFYNRETDKDANLARTIESRFRAYSSMAKIFGYVLFIHHRNDFFFTDIDIVSLSKDGELLYDFENLDNHENLTQLISEFGVNE